MSELQIKTIKQFMGYAYTPALNLEDRLRANNYTLVSPSIEITNQLQTIDEQLTQARADSMAQKIDDLQVNYTAHVAHLRSEGTRLLNQLSALLDYPLHFDKYSGRFPSQQRSSTSIASYW